MQGKRYWILILISLFVSVFQTSFLYELFGNILNINLLGAIIFALVLNRSYKAAHIVAILGGFLLDVMNGTIPGISGVLFTLLIFLVKYLRTFYLTNLLSLAFGVTLFFYGYTLIIWSSLLLDWKLIFTSLINTVLGFVIASTLKRSYEKASF